MLKKEYMYSKAKKSSHTTTKISKQIRCYSILIVIPFWTFAFDISTNAVLLYEFQQILFK